MKNRLLPLSTMLLAVAVYFPATVLMLKQDPFFARWYYCFAWWPFILFLQSWIRLRGGRATLYDNPGAFLAMLPLSVVIWLVFEVFNFRLNNWHYLNLPSGLPERWAGYALSYASVLPGLFTVREYLEHIGLFKNLTVRPLKKPRSLFLPFLLLGSLLYILPLAWPQYFFPLVWGTFVFLLEPINYQTGAPSLLRAWERGSARTFVLLLISGAICGLLWEFWNYWAGSKWVYTVPFVGDLKLFEMPVLGFLGFPPFAVECYALYHFLRSMVAIALDAPSPLGRTVLMTLITAAALGFTLVTFHGLDLMTVVSFAP